MRVRAGLSRLRASMSVPGTAWASVTTTIRLGEWKPWRLYGELVENPMAKVWSSISYREVRKTRPRRRCAAPAWAVLISLHRMSSTWRVVGPVTMTLAGECEWSHQRTALAAAQSLPEPWHPTTETRRDRATALRMSVCLRWGSSPRVSSTKLTGSVGPSGPRFVWSPAMCSDASQPRFRGMLQPSGSVPLASIIRTHVRSVKPEHNLHTTLDTTPTP